MDNIKIEGVSISEIFDDMKPGDERLINLEVARENSINVEAVERKTVLENVNMDDLRRRLAKIVITVVGVLVALNVGLNTIDGLVGDINDPLKMENMSRKIGSIVRQVDDPGMQTILSQNTYRVGDTVMYNQEGIAKDLLTFDSSVFDYALCSVCNDMGTNMNNNVGVQGMSNIDSVIYYLKMYSNMDGKYFNQYVSNLFRDVNSLDDYLLKNGYVDGGGNPSIEVFKTACNNNAQNVYDSIKSQVSNKGAGL